MHPVIRFSGILIPSLIAISTIAYSATVNPHSASWLAGFYLTLALFIKALKSAGKSVIHRAYALYLSMLSLYLIAVWLLHAMVPGSDVDATKQSVAFWTRILCIGSVYMPIALYHFTLRFSEARGKLLYVLEVAGWLLATYFYITNLSGSFLKDYVWSGYTWVPTMDGSYRYFFYLTSFYVSLAVVIPVVCIIRSDNRTRRLQLTYYLLGAIPLWVSCWGHFLISLGINIYPAGGTIFLLHAGIMAYAVFQRRVFDFTLVLRRALIYAAMSVSLGILYCAVVGFFLLFPNVVVLSERSQVIAFIVLSGFVFAPIYSYCQKFIDHFSFREQRNQQQLLQTFAQQTASTVDMKRIAIALCQCIDTSLSLKSVSLYLADEKSRSVLFSRYESGDSTFTDWPNAECLPRGMVIDPTGPRVVQDLTPTHIQAANKAVHVTERQDCVVVPLKQGEQIVGCMLLGAKLADEAFTDDNLRFTETVANYSAVALENGRSYLQLRQFQELTTEILNGLTAGVIVFDVSGTIVNVNEAARLFFPSASPFPRNVYDLVKLHPAIVGIIESTMKESNAVTNTELKLEAARTLSVLLSIRPLHHKNSSLFLLILHDISDYKEIEARSRSREHLAKLGETIASINHEIKNVVQPIRFQVETLQELQIDNSAFVRCMSILPNRLTALDRLLNDLRDLARPLELRKLNVDIGAVTESVLREVKCLPTVSSVAFEMKIDDTAKMCYADGHWLKLVLFNLLRNAAEATSQRPTPSVSISTSMQSDSKIPQILIKVADNGCGIPESSIPKLFTPFYSTKAQAGNGLGLAISRKVIELHGGTITVKSHPDVGTEFTIGIPLRSASAPAIEAQSDARKDG